MSVLKVEFNNFICSTAVNRPDAHNAVNFEVMDELEKLLSKLESDKQTRVLILRGTAGEAFISGGDLREFHTLKTAAEAKPMARRMRAILERIENLPCWTVACINGPAYGGGCEIMLAFDFRIASAEATFGFTQGKFYLPPGWGGLTRLVERVGRSTALRWLAETAVVDAPEALAHQLIDRIEPPEALEQATLKWADELSHNDRDFIAALKQGALQGVRNRWKAIEEELDPFARFWEDERHHRRVQRFLDRKKKP